ncbi:aminopeptidase N [Moorella thermoacetica Y72]|uniref:Aminopeptidase N n=2 Tax=Neomoorella thermoacetica TaxID=1525 RepID=A0A0S6UGC4_NEOTH|nr:aminopeptidase N [Moorella thermoacetica Y72]
MPKRIVGMAVLSLAILAFFFYPRLVPEPAAIATDATFKQVVLDPPPLEADGQVLVSAGDFLPLAGGSADWYNGQGVLRGAGSARVVAGSPVATLNGEPRQLKVPPRLVGDKLYIPLQLALAVLGTSSSQGGSDLPLPPLRGSTGVRFRYYPVYDLQARYDPASGEIQGELLLAYQNPFLTPLRQLNFNLPANAPFGNGASLAVTRAVVNNRPVAVHFKGSRLEVPLPRALAPRETLSVVLSFKTIVPPGDMRLGRDGNLSTVSGWYPILAPPTDDTWAGVAGTAYGDPYFAGAAYYLVRLTLPSGYQVLASSRLTGRQERGEWTDWSFNSDQPVREFAFTAAPDWQFTTRQAGRVQLVVASRGEMAPAVLDVAARALEFFQKLYGPYPYSYLHIAFVPLDNLAGMEYPGLLLLSNRKPYNPAVVVHEVAHQWWYNLVGNDTRQAAWIDEGLAEYSTLLFYRHFDPGLYQAKLAEITQLAARTGAPINLPLEEYGSEQDYRQAVYNRGAMFWLELERMAGEEQLKEALAYVQRYYRYEIIPPRALLTIITYYGKLDSNNFSPFLRNK